MPKHSATDKRYKVKTRTATHDGLKRLVARHEKRWPGHWSMGQELGLLREAYLSRPHPGYEIWRLLRQQKMQNDLLADVESRSENFTLPMAEDLHDWLKFESHRLDLSIGEFIDELYDWLLYHASDTPTPGGKKPVGKATEKGGTPAKISVKSQPRKGSSLGVWVGA